MLQVDYFQVAQLKKPFKISVASENKSPSICLNDVITTLNFQVILRSAVQFFSNKLFYFFKGRPSLKANTGGWQQS